MRKVHVERLAYWLWQWRGMPLGSPEVDWLLAEELLRRQYQRFEVSLHETPLLAFGIERRTK